MEQEPDITHCSIRNDLLKYKGIELAILCNRVLPFLYDNRVLLMLKIKNKRLWGITRFDLPSTRNSPRLVLLTWIVHELVKFCVPARVTAQEHKVIYLKNNKVGIIYALFAA